MHIYIYSFYVFCDIFFLNRMNMQLLNKIIYSGESFRVYDGEYTV